MLSARALTVAVGPSATMRAQTPEKGQDRFVPGPFSNVSTGPEEQCCECLVTLMKPLACHFNHSVPRRSGLALSLPGRERRVDSGHLYKTHCIASTPSSSHFHHHTHPCLGPQRQHASTAGRRSLPPSGVWLRLLVTATANTRMVEPLRLPTLFRPLLALPRHGQA